MKQIIQLLIKYGFERYEEGHYTSYLHMSAGFEVKLNPRNKEFSFCYSDGEVWYFDNISDLKKYLKDNIINAN